MKRYPKENYIARNIGVNSVTVGRMAYMRTLVARTIRRNSSEQNNQSTASSNATASPRRNLEGISTATSTNLSIQQQNFAVDSTTESSNDTSLSDDETTASSNTTSLSDDETTAPSNTTSLRFQQHNFADDRTTSSSRTGDTVKRSTAASTNLSIQQQNLAVDSTTESSDDTSLSDDETTASSNTTSLRFQQHNFADDRTTTLSSRTDDTVKRSPKYKRKRSLGTEDPRHDTTMNRTARSPIREPCRAVTSIEEAQPMQTDILEQTVRTEEMYINQVRERLQVLDFNEFLLLFMRIKVMESVDDIVAAMKRILEILEEHPDLVHGCNAFLPEHYSFNLAADQEQHSTTVSSQSSSSGSSPHWSPPENHAANEKVNEDDDLQ